MPAAGTEEGRAFLEKEKKNKESADVCHAQAPVTFSACHPQWVTPDHKTTTTGWLLVTNGARPGTSRWIEAYHVAKTPP